MAEIISAENLIKCVCLHVCVCACLYMLVWGVRNLVSVEQDNSEGVSEA